MLPGSGLYWLLYLVGQFENAVQESVKNARLFIVFLFHAGKHLKKVPAVKTLIAENVRSIVLLRITLM
jgi:hypothetical protein